MFRNLLQICDHYDGYYYFFQGHCDHNYFIEDLIYQNNEMAYYHIYE
jgi:hypothetical protein